VKSSKDATVWKIEGVVRAYAYVPSIGDAILTGEGLLVWKQEALVGGVEVALCECWGSCVDTNSFHESKTLVNLPGKRKRDAMVSGGVAIKSLNTSKMLRWKTSKRQYFYSILPWRTFLCSDCRLADSQRSPSSMREGERCPHIHLFGLRMIAALLLLFLRTISM
jgi:hypothetical protein